MQHNMQGLPRGVEHTVAENLHSDRAEVEDFVKRAVLLCCSACMRSAAMTSLCQTPTGSCRCALPDVVLGLVQQDEVVNTGQQGNNGDGNTGRVQVAMLEGGQAGNNVDGDPGEDSRCIPVHQSGSPYQFQVLAKGVQAAPFSVYFGSLRWSLMINVLEQWQMTASRDVPASRQQGAIGGILLMPKLHAISQPPSML